MMNYRIWVGFIFLSCSLVAVAQSFVNTSVDGERTVNICGNNIMVELDDTERTAALVDWSYKIKDAAFAINKTRRFKDIPLTENGRTLVIPETLIIGKTEYTVTTIGYAVFAGYRNVDDVQIPSSVTKIEDYAFFDSSIKRIIVPSTVQFLGKRVFGQCRNLKLITLPRPAIANQGLFAESKGVDVRFATFLSEEQPVLGNKSKVDKKTFASSSDVEIGIPVSHSVNDEMFALIIANESYQNVAKVDCALNDGRTFRHYCQQTLGIPEDHVHMVENATYGQMVEEVSWVTRIANAYEGEAKIIIYYAGHGIPNEQDGSAYLLPVDVSGDNTAAAYSLYNLYTTLGGLNVKSVTLFMDACFSGSLRGDGMLMVARGVAIKSKTESPKGNLVVFSAAQGDETAYPYAEKGHGLFTYFLLKKLKETKGEVDYGTLGDYIRKEVSRQAVVVNNKPQTPTVSFSPTMSKKWRGLKLK